MKIALLIQNADRRAGGAEGYTLDLARQLAARGHQITVIAEQGPEAIPEQARAAGFNCIYLGSSGQYRWARLQSFMQRLRDVYDNHTYDIVHAMLPVWRCDVYQPHAGLSTELLLTGHMKHPRRIVQRWSRLCNRWNLKRRGLARIETDMMRHQPWLLCFSTAMQNFARETFDLPAERLRILMNGIDLARFERASGQHSREAIRSEWHLAADQHLALFVGNNWKLKGVAEAIEAVALANDPRLVLMIMGRGEPGAYRRLAAKLHVSERVHFVGSVNDPRPMYGAADFLLLPTRRDTCSLVVLEALAMGLPVVTTRQNGASDLIENGRQGVIVERGDATALAEAPASLDDQRLAAMSHEALAMRSRLSFRHHVDRIEEVYEEVLSQHRQTAEKIE